MLDLDTTADWTRIGPDTYSCRLCGLEGFNPGIASCNCDPNTPRPPEPPKPLTQAQQRGAELRAQLDGVIADYDSVIREIRKSKNARETGRCRALALALDMQRKAIESAYAAHADVERTEYVEKLEAYVEQLQKLRGVR